MNWALLGPEIILAIFAIAVIILDLFVKRKGTLAVISILGLVGVIAATIPLWLSNSEIIREITYNPFFNGMLSVDRYALFFKVFFAGVAILIILASTDYVHKLKGFQGEYYALILLATLGMMFMAATRELISIYISLELTSISLYILAGFLKDNKSTEAGLKYMLLGSIASAILVYGMALV
ncbi:MAG: nuoN, partial [Dehalococcoidia bacterium]|nr:nuoN [Dehalococcoidia bacterium]